MKFVDNDIRRQYFRLYELIPLIEATDPHGRILPINGGQLVSGHNDFIDYVLSNGKVPDMVIDGSEKHWSIVVGKNALYTLYHFYKGNVLTTDGERIGDLPFHLRNRFGNVELSLLIVNPGAKDRKRIVSILGTSYGDRDSQNPQ